MKYPSLYNQRRHASGFSLGELLTVVCIIAIIAGIAVPSYQEFMRATRRADAVVALTDLANRLEQYYSDHNAYPVTTTEISAFLTVTASPQGYYTLSFVSSTASTYTIKATRTTGKLQANDSKCGDFTLTDQGVRSITGTGSLNDCWARN